MKVPNKLTWGDQPGPAPSKAAALLATGVAVS